LAQIPRPHHAVSGFNVGHAFAGVESDALRQFALRRPGGATPFGYQFPKAAVEGPALWLRASIPPHVSTVLPCFASTAAQTAAPAARAELARPVASQLAHHVSRRFGARSIRSFSSSAPH